MSSQSTEPREHFSWARLWQMVRKEVRQMWRDPKARPLLFVSPIMQMLLLGYAATTDVNNISTIVADHDRTAESRALIAHTKPPATSPWWSGPIAPRS